MLHHWQIIWGSGGIIWHEHNLDYTASNDKTIHKLRSIWKNVAVAKLRYFVGISCRYWRKPWRTSVMIFLVEIQTQLPSKKKTWALPLDQHSQFKIKLSLRLTNYALCYDDVWGSGCIDPRFLDLGTNWKCVVSFTPQGKSPRYVFIFNGSSSPFRAQTSYSVP
jgi:hypothetical protein